MEKKAIKSTVVFSTFIRIVKIVFKVLLDF